MGLRQSLIRSSTRLVICAMSASTMRVSCSIMAAAFEMESKPYPPADPLGLFQTRPRKGGCCDVAQALAQKSVRLIAGEFRDTIFTSLDSLRKRVAVRACAVQPSTEAETGDHWLTSSSMLLVVSDPARRLA